MVQTRSSAKQSSKASSVKDMKVSKEAMEVDEVDKEPEVNPQVEKDIAIANELKENLKLLEKGVSSKEVRYISKVVRDIGKLRRKLTCKLLVNAVSLVYQDGQSRTDIFAWLQGASASMDVSGTVPEQRKASTKPITPEVDIYLHLLVLLMLIDNEKLSQAEICVENLVAKIPDHRRTVEPLAAKVYYFYSRTYELNNKLQSIREFLHARLRTATLRQDYEGQTTLINLLLSNFLAFNMYDQAEKLISKSTFPPNSSNNELARFHYYNGRIKATQLEYTDSYRLLQNALRKAPQHGAVGFKQTVNRFCVVVQLLLGEIPERLMFRQAELRKTLVPYFQLTQAVRTGNLALFNETLLTHTAKFQREHTYTLIIRLRHNVIKTGVKMISVAYSKIHLSDIAKKLLLDSPEDAECIVSKVIRDGVIEGSIDHQNGFLQSKRELNIYSSGEPTSAFHNRIEFCLETHNQSVKAMRYPKKSYPKDLETAEERREREQQDIELAKELAEDDEDEDII